MDYEFKVKRDTIWNRQRLANKQMRRELCVIWMEKMESENENICKLIHKIQLSSLLLLFEFLLTTINGHGH